MNSSVHIVISMDDQNLQVFHEDACIREFAVSTSAMGEGFAIDSYRTPTGRFRICEKIGAGEPSGTIFKCRVPVGLWHSGEASEDDLILTRILRLEGLDVRNSNTLVRGIYIHGTNREDMIGVPSSHGCIRLCNADVIELFDMASVGDLVVILPASKHLEPS
jgi:hypothetical protein